MFTTVLDALQTGRAHITPRWKSLCISQEDLVAVVPAEPNKTRTHLLHHVQPQNQNGPSFQTPALLSAAQHTISGRRTPLDWWIQTTEPQISCEKWTSLYLQIHPSGATGPVQDNPQQCGARARFRRTPRLRSGLVNRNTLCIRNTSGRGGLKYPAQIQSLAKVSSLLRKKSLQHLREEGRRQRYISCQTNTGQKHEKMSTLLLRNSIC